MCIKLQLWLLSALTVAVTTDTGPDLRRSNALFVLKMKETRQMSQVAIDDMIEGCRELVVQRSQQIKSQVWEALSASGIDPEAVNGLPSTFTDEFDPFYGIETQYKQDKYFKEELGLLVSEITIWHQCLEVFILSNISRKQFSLIEGYHYPMSSQA